MSKQENNVDYLKIAVGYLSHMLVTFIIFAGVAYFANAIILDHAWNDNYFKFAGALFLVIALYSLLDCRRLYALFRTEIILSCCFLVSALLLLLSDYYVNIPIWLIGGIAAAALVNRNIGMLYVYFFVFHAIYLQGNSLNGLVFHFVCATVICLLIPKMKTWLSMLYLMIFSGCLLIVLTIVMNRFAADKIVLLDTFSILCSYFACIFITMVFVKLLGTQKAVRKPGAEEGDAPLTYDFLEVLAKETAELPENTAVTIQETENFSAYCDEKSELLQELKQRKKATYAHALLVGKLSFTAAEAVGLNAELTKAVGLYQKIGKLHNEEQESTILLLKEKNFPERLVQMISGLCSGRAEQKESAVVMIADEVISNYSVIRHAKKLKLPAEKIVDRILSKKTFEGALDNSGLSVSEYTGLRNVFVDFLKEQDKKFGIG